MFEMKLVGYNVNPARAGMIPSVMGSLSAGTGKPRASGDDPNDGPD